MAIINGDNNGNILVGTSDNDTINGFGGNDDLSGLGANDVMNGGNGNDVLRSSAGADSLFGDAGRDLVGYFTSASGVTVDLAAGTGTGGEAEGDTLSGVEDLVGSDFGDILTGSSGANLLRGWGGDDLLCGGFGADILIGDPGTDTATYYSSTAGVTVDLVTGNGAGGDAQGDHVLEIENLIGSNIGGDSLTGDNGANILSGSGGDDVLRGGAGADTLDGGTGIDVASYYASKAAVTVDLAAGTGSGDSAQGDVLISIEDLIGSEFGDTLTGSSAGNVLQGGSGDDLLRGGGGADSLFGDLGTDTATYYESASGVTVDLNTGAGTGGNAQGDILRGIENLTGSNIGGDSLIGSGGANVLRGWGGGDLLRGMGGRDTLTGGADADSFIYAATSESAVGANADRITDFSHSQGDRIDLSVIDADTTITGDQAFSFIGTALYSGVAGQLRFHSDGIITTIAGDVDGDGTSDFHIQLTGSIGLVAADFVL